MGAVPKRKVSRHRRGNRRRWQFLTAPELVRCPECTTMGLAYRVCRECGYYRGRLVIPQKAVTEDEE